MDHSMLLVFLLLLPTWIIMLIGIESFIAILLYAITLITTYSYLFWKQDLFPMFHIRSLVFYFHLRLHQWRLPKKLPTYLPDGKTAYVRGLLPQPREAGLERLSVGSGNSEDSFSLECVNEAGGMLSVKMAMRQGGTACVWLVWKEKFDSETFTSITKNNNDISMHYPVEETSNKNTFCAGGLTLVMLEPFRKWRIVYNGMMRNEATNAVEHVRINFIWSPLHNPFEWEKQADLWSVAKAAAEKKFENLSQTQDLSKNLLRGVDQYGCVFGTIMVGNEEREIEAYFRGIRRREATRASEQSYIETSSYIGVTDNGYQFSIRFKNLEKSDFVAGHLYIPGTNVFPMTQISWTLEKEDAEDLCKAIVQENVHTKSTKSTIFYLKFKANNRWFHAQLDVMPACIKFPMEGITCLKTSMKMNFADGSGLLCLKSERKEVSSDTMPPRFQIPISDSTTRQAVVSLQSAAACNSDSTGGKGSSLAQMLNCIVEIPGIGLKGKDWKIPKGVCVTASGFDLQLKESGLLPIIQEMENVFYVADQGPDWTELAEQACQRVTNAILSAKVLETISDELFEQLDVEFLEESATWLEEKKFAIRSSAIGEDSADLSAAGQNATFLGCLGRKRILQALSECWASLYAFQSVEYRRQNGQPIRAEMAVVVQEMVPADLAGVLFSRDPVNGNPSKIVITANYGLGESVVSARSEPDTVTVSYEPWNIGTSLPMFRIVEKNVGSKRMKIVMKSDDEDNEGETREEIIDLECQSTLCLSNSLSLKLAHLAVYLEKGFCSPRDIEFAVVNNEDELTNQVIYLLQARPITSFMTWTDFELIHELDSATPSKNDVLTTANLGEVFPGTSSALTHSLICKTLDLGMQKNSASIPGSQMSYNPCIMKHLCVSHQHSLFNFLDTFLQIVIEEKVTMPNRAIDMSIFGHEVTTKAFVEVASERRGLVTPFQNTRNMINALWTAFRGIYMKKRETFRSEYKLPFSHDAQLSSAELSKEILCSTDTLDMIFHQHGQASESSTLLQMITLLTLTEGSTEWSNEMFSDANSLFASHNGDVESAQVPIELKKLSEIICNCSGAMNFANYKSTPEAEQWIMDSSRSSVMVTEHYKKFLNNFHHRCIKEFELSSTPWGEDTEPLIQSLQAMVNAHLSQPMASGISSDIVSNCDAKDKDRKSLLEAKLNNMSRPLTTKTKNTLHLFVPWTADVMALRETTKSISIGLVHKLRVAFRKLGRALRREGRIPEEGLVWHLTLYELENLLSERSPELIQKAIRRRKLMPELEDLHFPELIHGVPKPIDLQGPRGFSSFECENSTVVKGTPVSRGVFTGVARVVTRLADAKQIQKGEILITVSTDIGWSPYFPLLGGVVTELGGLISHGAVVAREYGLPCVVGAVGATFSFKTGDRVQIDGRKGTVTRIDVPSEAETQT